MKQGSELESRIETVQGAGAVRALAGDGYALVGAQDLACVLNLESQALESLGRSWERLRPDEYLRDGGRYRFRRHGCFVEDLNISRPGDVDVASTNQGPKLTQSPHRAHWQPMTYNALHGGMERWFEPLESSVAESVVFRRMLTGFGALFARLRPVREWFIEAHQFRIDTAHGIGRPTPEGAHRDGVDFVALVLVSRSEVRGGETRVFQAQGNSGIRFTMHEPWSALLMDDTRVIHETTPIQPLRAGTTGHRDTLVLTYRERGFQAPG